MDTQTLVREIQINERVVLPPSEILYKNSIQFCNADNDTIDTQEQVYGTVKGTLFIYKCCEECIIRIQKFKNKKCCNPTQTILTECNKYNPDLIPLVYCTGLGTIVSVVSIKLKCHKYINLNMILVTVSEGVCYGFVVLAEDLKNHIKPIPLLPCYKWDIPQNVYNTYIMNIDNDGIDELILCTYESKMYIYKIYNNIDNKSISSIESTLYEEHLIKNSILKNILPKKQFLNMFIPPLDLPSPIQEFSQIYLNKINTIDTINIDENIYEIKRECGPNYIICINDNKLYLLFIYIEYIYDNNEQIKTEKKFGFITINNLDDFEYDDILSLLTSSSLPLKNKIVKKNSYLYISLYNDLKNKTKQIVTCSTQGIIKQYKVQEKKIILQQTHSIDGTIIEISQQEQNSEIYIIICRSDGSIQLIPISKEYNTIDIAKYPYVYTCFQSNTLSRISVMNYFSQFPKDNTLVALIVVEISLAQREWYQSCDDVALIQGIPLEMFCICNTQIDSTTIDTAANINNIIDISNNKNAVDINNSTVNINNNNSTVDINNSNSTVYINNNNSTEDINTNNSKNNEPQEYILCAKCLQNVSLFTTLNIPSTELYNTIDVIKKWNSEHNTTNMSEIIDTRGINTTTHRCIILIPINLCQYLEKLYLGSIRVAHTLHIQLDQLESISDTQLQNQNYRSTINQEKTYYNTLKNKPRQVEPYNSKNESVSTTSVIENETKNKSKKNTSVTSMVPVEMAEKLSDLELMIQIQAGYVRYCKAYQMQKELSRDDTRAVQKQIERNVQQQYYLRDQQETSQIVGNTLESNTKAISTIQKTSSINTSPIKNKINEHSSSVDITTLPSRVRKDEYIWVNSIQENESCDLVMWQIINSPDLQEFIGADVVCIKDRTTEEREKVELFLQQQQQLSVYQQAMYRDQLLALLATIITDP